MMFHFYFTGKPGGPRLRRGARSRCRPRSGSPFERWLARARRAASAPALAVARSAAHARDGGFRRRARGRRSARLRPARARARRRGPAGAARGAAPTLDARAATQGRAAARDAPVRRAAAVARPPARTRARARSRAPPASAGSTTSRSTTASRTRARRGPRAHGGAVVELHAYARRRRRSTKRALRADLIAGLHAFYPETRACAHRRRALLLRADCPAFPPGGYARAADARDRAARRSRSPATSRACRSRAR